MQVSFVISVEELIRGDSSNPQMVEYNRRQIVFHEFLSFPLLVWR